MKNFDNKRILTVAEAARYTGYSRGTIEYWLESGELKCEMPPSRGNGSHRFRRIRREHLDAFLDQHYNQVDESNTMENNYIYENTMTISPRKNNRGRSSTYDK